MSFAPCCRGSSVKKRASRFRVQLVAAQAEPPLPRLVTRSAPMTERERAHELVLAVPRQRLDAAERSVQWDCPHQ